MTALQTSVVPIQTDVIEADIVHSDSDHITETYARRNFVSQFAPERVLTHDELLNGWLNQPKNKRGEPKSEETKQAYREDIARFMSFVGLNDIKDVTTQHVQAYLDSLVEKERAIATIQRKLASISSFIEYVVRRKLLPYNLTRDVSIKSAADKNRNQDMSTMERRDVPFTTALRVIEGTRNPRDRALASLMFGAGLRVSEAICVRWKDITFQTNDNTWAVRVVGKGNKTRVAPIASSAVRDLQAWKELDNPSPDDFVFHSRRDRKQHINRHRAYQIISDAAKRAGVEGSFGNHRLRHSHAKTALERGCPLHVLRDQLGHSNIATTNKYLAATPGVGTSRYVEW